MSEPIPSIPLDQILDAVTVQVWDAIRRLPQLRKELFNGAEDNPYDVIPTGADIVGLKQRSIPDVGRPVDEVIEEAKDIFKFGVRTNHPTFFTAIPSCTSPLSWLGDLLASAFNAFSGAWQAAPGITTVELDLIAWLAAQIGLPSSAGGLFVSGGSMANLTALTLARDRRLKDDERNRGIVYFSDQAHFCVHKALRTLGFFDSQMRIISSDSTFRMDLVELEKAIATDKERGLTPFLIVANFGTTNTGAIDPLHEIADVAQMHGIWMHVDGAYGASVALSKSHRSLISGLERCDSLAWDAHKWLFQTFGCAIVLVRDKLHLAKSFTMSAEYLGDILSGDETPNLFNYGPELTRPARHMRLWFSLRVLGVDTFGRMIDHGFELSKTVKSEVEKFPDWQVTAPVTLSIVTFRYCPKGMADILVDQANRDIAMIAIESNVCYIMTTQLRGQVNLRICSYNTQTSINNMKEVIKQLNAIALEIIQKS